MENLVEEGKAKLIGNVQSQPFNVIELTEIGVSNFSSPKLERLLKTAKIHPVVNQVEIHPYFPQKGLVEYCQAKKIHVTAHCPLGGAPIPVLIGREGPGPLEDPTVCFSCYFARSDSIPELKPHTRSSKYLTNMAKPQHS